MGKAALDEALIDRADYFEGLTPDLDDLDPAFARWFTERRDSFRKRALRTLVGSSTYRRIHVGRALSARELHLGKAAPAKSSGFKRYAGIGLTNLRRSKFGLSAWAVLNSRTGQRRYLNLKNRRPRVLKVWS